MSDYDQQHFTGEKPLDFSLDNYRITDSTFIEEVEPRILLDRQTLAEPGNVICISGEAKSGKSAFGNIIIAKACASAECDAIPELEIKPNPNGHAVISIDTEQSRGKQQKNIFALKKRLGITDYPKNLYCYNIQTLDVEDYEPITDAIFEKAHKECGGIHVVLVDGSADYVRDTNDKVVSNANIKYFIKKAVDYETVIILNIHLNPGSTKEQGHYGSQLQRKVQSLLTVTKAKDDKNIICIEPKFLRDAGYDIPAIVLRYDREKKYHVYAGTRTSSGISFELATKIFGQNALKYATALEKIQKITGYKIRQSKDIFKELKEFEYIIQSDNDKLWRLNNDH